MCGEFAQAIPCLVAVQAQQTGIDRLAVDQALYVCYVQTRRFGDARELLTAGLPGAGAYAERYRALLQQLPALEGVSIVSTNSAAKGPN